jgi:hypothetical protein
MEDKPKLVERQNENESGATALLKWVLIESSASPALDCIN